LSLSAKHFHVGKNLLPICLFFGVEWPFGLGGAVDVEGVSVSVGVWGEVDFYIGGRKVLQRGHCFYKEGVIRGTDRCVKIPKYMKYVRHQKARKIDTG